MGGRELTTSGMFSPTQPHKWSWSATAGFIEMLLECCFKQHDTLLSLSMTKALHMLHAKLSFVSHVQELIAAAASYFVHDDGCNHHYCNQIQSFWAQTTHFLIKILLRQNTSKPTPVSSPKIQIIWLSSNLQPFASE